MLLCGKEIGAVDRTWHDVRLCVLREHRGPAQPPLQCTLSFAPSLPACFYAYRTVTTVLH